MVLTTKPLEGRDLEETKLFEIVVLKEKKNLNGIIYRVDQQLCPGGNCRETGNSSQTYPKNKSYIFLNFVWNYQLFFNQNCIFSKKKSERNHVPCVPAETSNDVLRCKYLVFDSSSSLKTRELSFAQLFFEGIVFIFE